MNNITNILQYKTLSRLPQESGFYSGDCPGAAAITILSSLFSSLRGTLGRHPVFNFPSKDRAGLFLIPYSLFSFFGNIEHRITFTGLAANPDRVPSSVRVVTTDKSGTVSIEGRNIPVLRTFGFHWNSSATNITGALHLAFQTAGTAIGETAAAPRNTLPNNKQVCRAAIGETAAMLRNALPNCQTFISETAAAPRNICRTNGHPSEKEVQSTEILKKNNEYRIANNEYRIRKAEDACLPDRQGIRNLTGNDTLTSFLSPFRPTGSSGRAATRNQKTEQPSHTMTSSHSMTAKYKTLSRLPQESGFYSGDCPGAAAITILSNLFSSPRVSPIFAGFTQISLPVINRPETGLFPRYCPPADRYSGQGNSNAPGKSTAKDQIRKEVCRDIT